MWSDSNPLPGARRRFREPPAGALQAFAAHQQNPADFR
jgi:hypothetical protein